VDPSVLASPSTVAAGILAAVAGMLLGVFFATGSDAWGRANDAASAAFAVLLVPAALVLYDRYAPAAGVWAGAFTTLGLAAIAAAAVSSALTALGRLSVADLTKWQGGSFAALFLWVGAVSVSVLAYGGLPAGIGWLGLAATGLALVATLEIVRIVRRVGIEELARLTRPPVLAAGAALAAFVAFPLWCISLGLAL